MVQGRLARRRVVSVSSDENDGTAAPGELPESDEEQSDEEAKKPVKPTSGQLKSIRTTRRPQQSTPSVSSTQEKPAETLPKKSPKKSNSTKVKSKTAAKADSKSNGKPIYSFFNGTTQKQVSQQPPASQARSLTPQPETEAIDSDEDKVLNVKFSKGSSTALAVRKRKFQLSQSLDDEVGLLPPATQKFRKTSDGSRTPSFSVANDDKRSWIEQFAPVNLDELAVHKRKVADVRQWLNAAYDGKRRRVLVLKGAAGTGKTTTIRLLAHDLNINVSEWRNPAGADYAAESSVSAAEQFNDFIATTGRSQSLTFTSSGDNEQILGKILHPELDRTSSPQRQMLLVEEFPNTFSRTSPVLESFRAGLSQYLATSQIPGQTPTPIVLIVSETLLSTSTAAADSFTVHRLLGPELLNHPFVDIIEFNSIATTILTKALEGVVVKEARKSGRRRTPGPAVLKRLAETGDIRSAVSSLEFLCLRGDEEGAWSAQVTFTKPKKAAAQISLTNAEEEALRLICNRESSLGIFHSVGKIVYNKRAVPAAGIDVPQPPSWLPQHRRSTVPETNVDALIDELGTDTSTFVASLHENFVLSCNAASTEETLDSISGCVGNISDADLLSLDRFSSGTRSFSGSATDTLRQDEMSFQVAVRGVLFSLPCPVHRGISPSGKKADSHRMFYPASLKIWRQKEEIGGLLELLTAEAQVGGVSQLSRSGETGADGVAGWKRQAPDPEARTTTITSSTSVKGELLLDRLPYMSLILSSTISNTALLTRIRKVVHIQTLAPDAGEADEDYGAAGEQGVAIAAEQWSTDPPEDPLLHGIKKKAKRAVQGDTEGGGLHIPIEGRVERLILEEDDIVDD